MKKYQNILYQVETVKRVFTPFLVVSYRNAISGIFPNTFLQPINGSKNSMYFFFLVFETLLKDVPFYSPILLTLWFRYLQTRIKERFM